MSNGIGGRRLFLGCFFALVATAFGFVVRAMILDDWRAQFNLSGEQIGYLVGAGPLPLRHLHHPLQPGGGPDRLRRLHGARLCGSPGIGRDHHLRRKLLDSVPGHLPFRPFQRDRGSGDQSGRGYHLRQAENPLPERAPRRMARRPGPGRPPGHDPGNGGYAGRACRQSVAVEGGPGGDSHPPLRVPVAGPEVSGSGAGGRRSPLPGHAPGIRRSELPDRLLSAGAGTGPDPAGPPERARALDEGGAGRGADGRVRLLRPLVGTAHVRLPAADHDAPGDDRAGHRQLDRRPDEFRAGQSRRRRPGPDLHVPHHVRPSLLRRPHHPPHLPLGPAGRFGPHRCRGPFLVVFRRARPPP